jgi:hypothetical protein
MLNPFIYSLRNREMKGPLRDILRGGNFSVWRMLSSLLTGYENITILYIHVFLWIVVS